MSPPITSQPLSPIKRNWLAKPYRTHSTSKLVLRTDTRTVVLLEKVMTTSSLADPSVSVFVNYETSPKGLWDGEPEMIVNSLPVDFWDDFPCHGELTEIKKKAFIGEFLKDKLNKGDSKHSKMNLRKVEVVSGNGPRGGPIVGAEQLS